MQPKSQLYYEQLAPIYRGDKFPHLKSPKSQAPNFKTQEYSPWNLGLGIWNLGLKKSATFYLIHSINTPSCTFYFLLFTLYSLLFTLYSCKPAQKAATSEKHGTRPRSTKHILEQVRAHNSEFEWFASKINATVTYEDKPFSVNLTLHIRRDSLIWMSVSQALGFEMARLLITNDSVKFLNRLNQTYLVSNFDSLNRMFRTDFNFNSLQSLLTATDLSYFLDLEVADTANAGEEIRFRSGIDNGYYFLGTISKRKLRKSSHRKKEMRLRQKMQRRDPEMEYIQGLWITPDSFRVSQMLIDEIRTSRKFKIGFSDYRQVENQFFPFNVVFELGADKPVSLELNYTRITLNQPQSIRFSISEKYKPMGSK